ncbi:MAG: hypothetical protein CM1200mP41_33800 [Gammaproteobacteria bacterium]|nr:MAG: hypothetical protein CM1200mP41_33800 [Gammaproteobacteria bacterium]
MARDTRDNRQFPSKGFLEPVGAEISFPGSDLEFYTVSARGLVPAHWEKPDFRSEWATRYGAGYGELDALPFYKNFYAGGARSLEVIRPLTWATGDRD